MTELTVRLPDELAKRAKDAGLLSDSAIQQLLEDAMRRTVALGRLLAVAPTLEAMGIEPMSEEEILAEVKAVRAARRARKGTGADRS